MSPRGPSGASKSQKAAFSKTLKNNTFFEGFWAPEASQESPKMPKKAPKRHPKSSKTPQKKGSKNTKKLMVFQGFWKCSFLALWSSWWLSWAHLAPSLADLVPKWAPKWFPKVVQKVIKKLVKNDTKSYQKWHQTVGPKRVPLLKKSLWPQTFFRDLAF